MDFAKRRSEIDEYLPTYKKGKYPNRQFFCNLGKITCLMTILIVNSLLLHDFTAFIAEKIKEREVKVVKKKDLEIKALPEFVNLFKNTNYISCKRIIFLIIFQTSQKGKSNVLIRRNLKRSRDEFEEEKKCIEIEILQKEKDKLEM